MNKVKVATVTALLAALITGAACGTATSGGDEVEVLVNCYTVDGKFVKRDDDCHDDKDSLGRPLTTQPPGGLQTAKQAAPTKAPTRAAPRPRRT